MEGSARPLETETKMRDDEEDHHQEEEMILGNMSSREQENERNDDDDEGDFLFQGINSGNMIEIDEKPGKKVVHSLFPLFVCLITKNNQKIKEISYDTIDQQDAVTITRQLLEGKYLEMIHNNKYIKYEELYEICKTSQTPYEDICRVVSGVINNSTSAVQAEMNCYQCFLLGYAYFELYCQCNYTGPELSPVEISHLTPDENTFNTVTKNVLRNLECDGVYPFRLCQLPHALFIARSIMLYLADPSRASWQHGIHLDSSGKILPKLSQNELDLKTVRATKCLDILKNWLSFRLCVIHARLLQSQHYTKLPTLWKECEDMTGAVDQGIERFQDEALNYFHCSPKDCSERGKFWSEFLPTSQVRTLYLLEKGLSYHYFDFQDKGKKLFSLAKDSAHLQVKLTAAMGKRTKYQIDEHAQLLLVVHSNLVDNESNEDAATLENVILTESKSNNPSETKREWEHGKYELGRRVVAESSTGEEVSIRNIRLDDTDGGEAENILLEEGVHFSHVHNQVTEDSLSSTLLHPIDQAVILSLCLDVSNSNPADGLTTEEMHPYIMSILNQYHKHQKLIDDIDIAKRKAEYELHTQGKTSVNIPVYNQSRVEIYLNWMIYSTALLERSYLEYEKRRTMDRAMLQIQALLDQHTTKLTTFQPDRNLIEDAAPAWERMKYMPCLIYPSQYEIKRDLADRYLRCQVFNSALNLFKELEMWDEVVTCFQLLQKPHRAELLVRERLSAGEETPYMICALADLTKDESLYLKSWEISNKRYGRPLRTLARICFDSDRFSECVDHLDQALAVQPLVANAWYLRGIANMRLEVNWSEAIVSFNRCLQQDMEIGEAWANIGAVQMKQKNWSRAYDAFQEAQKHKPREWRIIENLMMTTLEMKRLKECIYHMNSLLDLRHLSNRPLHQDELRELIILSAIDTLRFIREKDAKNEAENIDLESMLPGLTKDVEALILRITNTLKSENHIWETASMYHTILANGDDPDKKGELGTVGPYERQLQMRSRAALFDLRLKQLRSVVQVPNWERDIKQIAEMIRVSGCLMIASRDNLEKMTKNDFYACKSLLSSSYLHLVQFYEKNGKSIKEVADIEKLPQLIDEFNFFYTSKSE